MRHFWLLFLLVLAACSSESPEKYSEEDYSWQEFQARNEELSLVRPVIYRAFVPNSWTRKDFGANGSISDTKKPICEFIVADSADQVHLTIHTFPFNHSQARIPCQAQMMRWKNQFEELHPLLTHVYNETHGGFCGMKLEAQGVFQQKEQKMIAWSMELANEHERQLHLSARKIDNYKLADYTIKVVGSPHLVDKHKNEIQKFAESFELIEELHTTL